MGPSASGSSNAIYTGQSGAAGVAVYNSNVYWGTPKGIAFGPFGGNASVYSSIPSPDTPVAGVAVDDTGGGVLYLDPGKTLYRYVTGSAGL